MTRYVCSWCRRKQEGVNLSSCENCHGPLEYANRLGDQQQEVRDRLRKATTADRLRAEEEAAREADKQALSQGTGSGHPGLPHPAYRHRMARIKQPAPKPLPPPVPKKPKPLLKVDRKHLSEDHPR